MLTRIWINARFLLLAFLLTSGYGLAQETEKSVRLFIIGNSFSGNASRYLPDLAHESGTELIIGRAELGGCSLQRHWEIAEAYEADPADPTGRQYRGKSLKMLLSEGTWDYITIQQNSMNSTDVTTYRPYAKKLYDYIKAIQPHAEVVIHQTWAYRIDSKRFGRISESEHAKDATEMYEASRRAYHTIADELDVRLLPVGDAFRMVNTHPKFGFKSDPNFDYESPSPGALPVQTYSLHTGYYWKKDNNKFTFDSNHANQAGEFLGSLVWYGVLFDESPAKVKFTPPGISEDFAKYLKEAASKAVKKNQKRQVAAP